MKRFRALLVLAALAGVTNPCWGGAILYSPIPVAGSDAKSGIGNANQYTTAIDGGNATGTDRVINGATLYSLGGGSESSSAKGVAVNALSGNLANGAGSSATVQADGALREVLLDMTYNNAANDNSQQEIVLDPETLQAGVTYDLRVYICNSGGQDRQVNLVFAGDGQHEVETGWFNEDDARTSAGRFTDANQVYVITYRFTWDGETTPGITISQKSGEAPFCLYALTNQAVPTEAAAKAEEGGTAGEIKEEQNLATDGNQEEEAGGNGSGAAGRQRPVSGQGEYSTGGNRRTSAESLGQAATGGNYNLHPGGKYQNRAHGQGGTVSTGAALHLKSLSSGGSEQGGSKGKNKTLVAVGDETGQDGKRSSKHQSKTTADAAKKQKDQVQNNNQAGEGTGNKASRHHQKEGQGESGKGKGKGKVAKPTATPIHISPAILSDRRMKKNISFVGWSPMGIPIYQFSYISEPNKRYQGTIAQAIIRIRPEAVVCRNGLLFVDYSQLDIEMEELPQDPVQR